MNSRRFAGIFFAIFLLGALPLLLVQPTGLGSAGLSAGFMAPLNAVHLSLLLFIGLWASWLDSRAIFMLPVTFILMTAIAGLLVFAPNEIPYQSLAIFACILLFALSVASSYSRAFIVSASVTASVAFHLGSRHLEKLPDLVSPAYYLLGILISTSLILATGVSLGLTVKEDIIRLKSRMRSLPALAHFISFF